MKVGIAHARPMHGAAMLAKTRNLKMARSSHAYKCGRLSLGRCAAQQGADFGAIAREAKADDHAIGCLQSLALIIAHSPLKYDPSNLLVTPPSRAS
jgi:hypothetical protein